MKGEYFRPATARERLMRRLTLERADENARRLGMDRRQFLASAMGMCTTLLVINEVTACSSNVIGSSPSGKHGWGDSGGGGSGGVRAGGAAPDAGGHCVPPEAMFDESCANAILGGKEFIFDIETRWVNAADVANSAYAQAFGPLFAVLDEERYIKDVFCSDTAVVCLTGWPGILCTPARRIGCGSPLSNESIVASRDKINALAGNSQRALNQVTLVPQDASGIAAALAVMEEFHCEHGVAAWELYPGFKPGFRFDGADGLGESVLRKGLELGVNRFCIHKGAPVGNFFDAAANYPDDIGPIAAKYRDANFIIYHAAICAGLDSCATSVEGPHDATSAKPTGTDALIRTVLDSGIPPGGNVYAETGTAFRDLVTSPDQAAHFFGKLLKYLGPNNVLWGSGSIVSGAPQPLIEAFRTLTIPQSMQETYGYPALTPDIKAKVFGLNAATLYGVDPNATRCQVSVC